MKNLKEKVEKILGWPGRLITSSKGRYSFCNPENIIFYNANIYTVKGEKIWHGDLDLTHDCKKIKKLSRRLLQPLYVLREIDGRFDNENSPDLSKAVFVTNGMTEIIKVYSEIEKRKYKSKGWRKYWYYKKNILTPTVYPERDERDYIEKDFPIRIKIKYNNLRNDTVTRFNQNIVNELYSRDYTDEDMGNLTFFYSKETEDKLMGYIKNYAMKEFNLKEDSYELQKELSWVILALPCTFQGSLKGPSWAKPNIVYAKNRIKL